MDSQAISQIAFGASLRQRRTAAGRTLSDLARTVSYSKSHLSKIESGAKKPSVALARSCDTALKAGGQLSALVPQRSAPAQIASDAAGEVWTMTFGKDGSTEFGVLDRRALFGAGGASLLSWVIAPPTNRRGAAQSTLPQFRALFDQLRALGQTAPASTMSRILIPMTQAVRDLAVDNDSSSRAEALQLASRFAEYTGWMAQEVGAENAALWWTSHAVELAGNGDDPELAAYALVRRAELAMFREDSISTIGLAQEARKQSRSARVRGFALQREAQGHALAGDEHACLTALEQAEKLSEQDDQDSSGSPLLGSATVRSPLNFVTAWCMYDLGRPRDAVKILGPEFALVDDSAHRTQARYGARLGLALIRSGDVDQAVDLLGHVLARMSILESATVRHDLRQLRQCLRRFRTHAGVQQIGPALTMALHTSTAQPIRYQP